MYVGATAGVSLPMDRRRHHVHVRHHRRRPVRPVRAVRPRRRPHVRLVHAEHPGRCRAVQGRGHRRQGQPDPARRWTRRRSSSARPTAPGSRSAPSPTASRSRARTPSFRLTRAQRQARDRPRRGRFLPASAARRQHRSAVRGLARGQHVHRRPLRGRHPAAGQPAGVGVAVRRVHRPVPRAGAGDGAGGRRSTSAAGSRSRSDRSPPRSTGSACRFALQQPRRRHRARSATSSASPRPRASGSSSTPASSRAAGSCSSTRPRGEYAGALELKFLTWSIKAIGLLSTKRPDGSDGWSLLLFVFGQFNVHIAFGIFWTGARRDDRPPPPLRRRRPRPPGCAPARSTTCCSRRTRSPTRPGSSTATARCSRSPTATCSSARCSS